MFALHYLQVHSFARRSHRPVQDTCVGYGVSIGGKSTICRSLSFSLSFLTYPPCDPWLAFSAGRLSSMNMTSLSSVDESKISLHVRSGKIWVLADRYLAIEDCTRGWKTRNFFPNRPHHIPTPLSLLVAINRTTKVLWSVRLSDTRS